LAEGGVEKGTETISQKIKDQLGKRLITSGNNYKAMYFHEI
jgi:hypothetical protein